MIYAGAAGPKTGGGLGFDHQSWGWVGTWWPPFYRNPHHFQCIEDIEVGGIQMVFFAHLWFLQVNSGMPTVLPFGTPRYPRRKQIQPCAASRSHAQWVALKVPERRYITPINLKMNPMNLKKFLVWKVQNFHSNMRVCFGVHDSFLDCKTKIIYFEKEGQFSTNDQGEGYSIWLSKIVRHQMTIGWIPLQGTNISHLGKRKIIDSKMP